MMRVAMQRTLQTFRSSVSRYQGFSWLHVVCTVSSQPSFFSTCSSPCSRKLYTCYTATCRQLIRLWFLLCVNCVTISVQYLPCLSVAWRFTFSKVQDNSEKVWRFYRYGLIYDYFERPALAPPLIIFSHLWRIIGYFYQRCVQEEKIGHDFCTLVSVFHVLQYL